MPRAHPVGQTVGAFWHSVRHAKPLAVGLNCALGAALMRPYIEELAKVAGDTFISCYPNAGLPNPMSDTGFDETPDVTGSLMEGLRQGRLPEHRRRLLRHHAGAHRADCPSASVVTSRAAGMARCSASCCPPERPRAAQSCTARAGAARYNLHASQGALRQPAEDFLPPAARLGPACRQPRSPDLEAAVSSAALR
jgi:hypothetical protein